MGQTAVTISEAFQDAVLHVLVIPVLFKAGRWFWRMKKRATWTGVAAMLVYGWDLLSDPAFDEGPLGEDGSDKLTWSGVAEYQLRGSMFLLAVRWSTISYFVFFAGVPAITGQPVPVGQLVVAAVCLFMVTDLSQSLDHPSSLAVEQRWRVALSATLLSFMAVLTALEASRPTQQLFWVGVVIVTGGMFVAALTGRTSRRARTLGSMGWLMMGLAVPGYYPGQMGDAIAASITLLVLVANVHSAYRSIQTSRSAPRRK